MQNTSSKPGLFSRARKLRAIGERSVNMNRVRISSGFSPEFNSDSISGWAYKVAVSQMWRVYPEYEIEDLMQEAGLIFARLLKKYPQVDNIKWFAALFRVSFLREIHDIANKRSRRVGNAITDLNLEKIPEVRFTDGGIPEVAFRDAPPHIKAVLDSLVDNDADIPRLPIPRPVYRDTGYGRRAREPINDFLCRIAGVSPVRDLASEVVDWLLYGEARVS